MFRAFLLAAGLMLALGTLTPADAARSRARTTGTEAAASTEAPQATSRRNRRPSAQRQRRNRGQASSQRQRRGSQHASAAGRRGSRNATVEQ